MIIDYPFRKPKFPIICIIDDILVTANAEAELQHRIDQVDLTTDACYPMTDSTGSDWEFYTNQMYVIPTAKRKWSKKRIIKAYNDSQNCQRAGTPYSEKSLSSKRFEIVFADIVELVEQAQ